MKTFAAALLLSLASATTFAAEVGDVPPTQEPAGSPAPFERFSRPTSPTSATPVAEPEAAKQPMTAAERRAARKAIREAKVGPKPLN